MTVYKLSNSSAGPFKTTQQIHTTLIYNKAIAIKLLFITIKKIVLPYWGSITLYRKHTVGYTVSSAISYLFGYIIK